MGSATMRAVESTIPPGGAGTTRLTGRVGNGCDSAGPGEDSPMRLAIIRMERRTTNLRKAGRLTGARLRERHRPHRAVDMVTEAGWGRARTAITAPPVTAGSEGWEQARDDELTLAPRLGVGPGTTGHLKNR